MKTHAVTQRTRAAELSWQLEATPPLFGLGDRVMIMTVGDEVYISVGVVMGLEWCPVDTYVYGWWYSVHCIEGDGQGLRDIAPEDELINLSLLSPLEAGL